jgi:DnaJ-class molecular chaperone
LGVEHTATPEQIKDAYRAAVKMYHPDVAGSSTPDAEKFRHV